MAEFIYLASQSPRRAQLLEQLGARFERLLPLPAALRQAQGDRMKKPLALSEEEQALEALEAVHGREAPARYVKRVTGLKLDAAVARLRLSGLPVAPVLCSDTTVALGSQILGKPESAADAVRMLTQLSGKTHRVLTAVAIQNGRQRHEALSVSSVTFAAMSAAQIKAYVATGEPMGKAGAYAVQGRAAMYITRISGSYSGIMGLPLHETALLLKAAHLKI